MGFKRPSGRAANELRPVVITRGFTKHAAGSVLVEFGDTKVICTASVETGVPCFLRGQGVGWLTAEYGMLPASTHTRSDREAARGKQGGRSVEIQRLIGRSLRAAVDTKRLGERTVRIDCDVLQADGGTRTASITGACVALADALTKVAPPALVGLVASVSVGIYRGSCVLDLDYAEDSRAETDMNVVMMDGRGFIEVQGTAETGAFPEVFARAETPGFDAMVGNPPFIGGQKITGAVGTDYRNHLIAWTAGGKKGSADLVAYFFLNATKTAQSLGFLATNTIAQGDTSEVGLTQIIDAGWKIHRAVPSTTWPGDATLEIAKVWATSSRWDGRCLLDGRTVADIDEMLYPVSASGWRKRRLAANADKSFQGSIVLGTDGFTMSPEEAQALIAKDPRNAEVLFPYLGGEDLNQSPTQVAPRWIINFFDWPEEKAREYPDCFTIVEEKVKPGRETNRRKQRREYWWRYAERAVGLYRTIAPLERVLAMALVSKPVLPVFVRSGQVLSHKTVVFAYDDDFHFGVLTSGFHYRWAVRHSSSLETRTNYSPSDVFVTFPQPPHSDTIASVGETLDACRSSLMADRMLGLTDVYNLVHDPTGRSDERIRQLRDLHVRLDLAVRDAYGWPDLELGHGFHDVRGQGVRFTFSPEATDEALDRLLELNKKRYEAEVATGLHEAAEKNKAPRSRPAKQRSLLGDDG